MTGDRTGASFDLATPRPPATGDAWPLCGGCAHFADGMCRAEAWSDWPERDPKEFACSEHKERP